MQKLKCIAVDDEPQALVLLKAYSDRVPTLNMMWTFEDAIEAKTFLENTRVDLLFVDINMPDINGLDLVKSLDPKPMVIFTTAYRKFAFEGFELEAIDYLLKPISFEKFEKAAQKAVSFQRFTSKEQAAADESIFVRSEYKMVRIPLQDILYIESLEDYIKIHLENQRPVLTLFTLKAMFDMLPREKFIRIHRSYIVPLAKINTLHNKRVKIGSEVLPVGESYLADLKASLSI